MKKYILIVFYLVYTTLASASSYGVELSDSEKLVAFTNYFMQKDSKLKKLSLPQKPKKLALPQAKVLTKSKYEKIKTFEDRVKQEEENYLKRVEIIENKYLQSLEKYDKKVQKITDIYNKKNNKQQEKVKQNSIQKAYTVVYGNPQIAQDSLEYDAETEKFSADLKSTKGSFHERIVVNVPTNEAEQFEKKIKHMKLKVMFELKGNKQILDYISMKSSKKSYIAKLK